MKGHGVKESELGGCISHLPVSTAHRRVSVKHITGPRFAQSGDRYIHSFSTARSTVPGNRRALSTE